MPRRLYSNLYVQSRLLYDTLAMRSLCKTAVSEMGQSMMWVPDVVHKMLPGCDDNVETRNRCRSQAFMHIVHLCSSRGCKNLPLFIYFRRTRCMGPRFPARGKPKTFHWRGFMSPIGSQCPFKESKPCLPSIPPRRGWKWKANPMNVGN
jgi:hypothetical protein